MKIIITNAIALSMLQGDALLDCIKMDKGQARQWLANYAEAGAEIVSAVGHVDTARVFSTLLRRDVPANRVLVEIPAPGEGGLLVGQYKGPRLPEGATTLPEGANIEWWLVCATTPAWVGGR